MSQQNNGLKAFKATSAVVAYRRVKYDGAGAVSYAGVGEVWIGVTQAAGAAGDFVTVLLRTAIGTCKVCAAEALADGATLYAAANGKVKDTASGTLTGIALEAALADGDIIEALLYQ